MARHESEMHRQRRELRNVLVLISERSSDPWARDMARLVIECQLGSNRDKQIELKKRILEDVTAHWRAVAAAVTKMAND